MIRLLISVVAAVLAGTVAAAGCAPGPVTGEPVADSATAIPSVAGSAAPPSSQDVRFATMMIAHHGQAVWMSRTLLAKRDVPERVAAVADFIRTDQQREIDEMNRWLVAWKQPAVKKDDPRAAGLHGAGHGMLSGPRLSVLADVNDGGTATRLYLAGMIEHHQGALTMARAVLKVGRNVYIRNLAKHIINEQGAEIRSMSELLRNPA